MRSSPGEPNGLPVYAIRNSVRATRDMDAAMAFLDEAAGPTAAIEWFDGLRAAIGALATLPDRCPVADEAPYMKPPPVRVLLYQRSRGAAKWRVLYRVREAGDQDPPRVEVLTVRHASAKPLTRREARAIDAEAEYP